MRALLLLVCGCCLLAGCGGLVPHDGPASPTSEPTVTPAPVPDDSAPVVLPGVGADGPNETERFRAVNHEAFENTSLRTRTVFQLETVDDGSPLARAITTRRVENSTTMRFEFQQYAPDLGEYAPTDVSVWVGPDAAFERVEQHGGTTVTQRPANPRDVRRVVRPDPEPLVETLGSTTLRREDRYTVDGETWYVLTGERDRLPAFVDRVETTENRDVTLTARVDATGVVRAFVIEWRGEFRDEAVCGTYAVRLQQVGDVTAPRPTWVERLHEATPTRDTTAPGTPTPSSARDGR
ncbi:hypothetical protein N0B31_10090 [Salinirubellus salinus]|uniref:Uncharacterized protein n=1 Tax=Salinirubellus salinus TaxID=1364945 RepID=A0A9E7R6A7_9EURY|nr:hypothetical protein [Salinirubellus salinus]UWM56624.1 hypothetical protein N0B31_10090 [Salinirubellus salinus]